MDMKDKLISFPEEILEVLEEYRQKTGIPATDYIRRAVLREMIADKLIFIKMKYITFETKNEEEKEPVINMDAIESNKFCDGDKCEIDPLMMAGGCGK